MATLSPARLESSGVDIKVVDVDTRLPEPGDLWLKRAPARLKDRLPQIVTLDGQKTWLIDGRRAAGLRPVPGNDRHDGQAHSVRLAPSNGRDWHHASPLVRHQLAHMDQHGIHAQIVYPGVLGFGGQNLTGTDDELRLASIQIYNEAMAELQDEAGNRLLPMALLPWWDVASAVEEAMRAHRMGLRGININPDPHNRSCADNQPIPDLSQPYWEPLWEVCADLGLPINFHVGTSKQPGYWMSDLAWPSLRREMKASLSGSMLFLYNGRIIGNLILSGMLDRHPKLKFVSVESGIGWIPFMMESLDRQVEQIDIESNLLLRPSDYFRRNFHACFWFEKRDLTHVVEQVGIDNVMFEADSPPFVGPVSSPLDRMDEALARMDEEPRRKVMSSNAARLYNIPL